MKNFKILLLCLFTTLLNITLEAQTNETPASFYTWGRKSTELAKGYLVLQIRQEAGRNDISQRK